MKSCAISRLTRCYDFSSVIPSTLFSASASAPSAVCVMLHPAIWSCVWVWVWGRLSMSETINAFWAEPLPECQCKRKLYSESKHGGVPRAVAKNEHNLWPCVSFDFKASDERKPLPPSCLALLITFSKNWRLKKFGSAEVRGVPPVPAATAENFFSFRMCASDFTRLKC